MSEGFAIYNRRTNKLEGVKECAVVSTTELNKLRAIARAAEHVLGVLAEFQGEPGIETFIDEHVYALEDAVDTWKSHTKETRQC